MQKQRIFCRVQATPDDGIPLPSLDSPNASALGHACTLRVSIQALVFFAVNQTEEFFADAGSASETAHDLAGHGLRLGD